MGRRAEYGRALSPRERAVLAGLCRGLSRADLARRLGVAPETVKRQAHAVYRKLGVPDRFAAAALVLDQQEGGD